MTKLIHNLTNSPNLVERIKGIDRDIDTLNAKVGSIPEGMDIGQSIIDLQDNKQDKLTAGEGISIENNVISNTQRPAEWGNITGDITNQADLQNELSSISDSIPTNTSDLTNDSGFITNSVNDLVNYYLKSETYTQEEVNNLIGSIQSFHYEIYPTIGSITTPLSNVLYLIGPIGTGSDRYEEYVYSNNNFVKIGETSIDLSGYVTIDNLNNALSNYTTTANLTTLLAQKQDVLTAGVGISVINNVISNTIPGATISNTAPSDPTQGMLRYDTVNDVLKSYDGSNWNEVGNESSDINTKAFYLSGTSDLTNAQAAYDWFSAGKNPIVMYNNRAYLLYAKNATQLIFQDIENSSYDQNSYTEYVGQKVIFTLSGNDVTAINYDSISGWSGPILRTDVDYPTPYAPTYAGSPTTKQYVDNNDTYIGTSAPTYNVAEGRLWYDTTNDVLKVYDGTNWNAVGTDTTYTAGNGIDITNNEISADTSVLATKNDLNSKQDTLTAGSGINIDSNNEISADTSVLATKNDLNSKQDALTAGNHIDITNNVISATGFQEELTAGENITIGDICTTESDMKGPCSKGYHVPISSERQNLVNILFSSLHLSSTAETLETYLLLPRAGERTSNYVNISDRGSHGYYWSADRGNNPTSQAYYLLFFDGGVLASGSTKYIGRGLPVRAFKNTPVIPDGTWNTLYDGSSIATGAGVFHNPTLGLISASGDGTTRITVADKNLGATTVYTVGDTLSETNCGYYYQWGNCYGFAGDGNIQKTSNTVVDTTGKGPGNYYSSDTFITKSAWDSSENFNLWGAQTHGTWQDCIYNVISATDTTYTAGTGISIDANNVISNTQTSAEWGNITGTLSDQTDLQTVLNAKQDNMVILKYGISTWNDFITAYNKNGVIYCRASSNSNPASGSQTRLAFMAYVNNETTPTEVEFQYYRSRSSHSTAANVLDEVYVYKLVPADGGTWTVTQRDTAAKPIAGTGIGLMYNTSGITINADTTVLATKTDLNSKQDTISDLAAIRSGAGLGATAVQPGDNISDLNNDTGYITANDLPAVDTSMSDSSTNAVQNNVIKNYVDTQVQEATSGAVSDIAYGTSWNGITGIAPSKNAVYDKISAIDTTISGHTSSISTINGKIPSEASAANQLADKDFVGDSINSVTAYYITKNAAGDQWTNRAELFAATTFYSGGVVRIPTKNDYTIVLSDEQHNNATTRYIYNNGWEYQYTVNETAMTQAQLNAINSGITSAKVSTYDGYATGKQDTLSTAQLNAVNSGITSSKVTQYDGYATSKQDNLTAGNGIDITNNVVKTTFNYGTSSTAAATAEKVVSIPAITELNVGQVIIVHPTETNSVANSTIKLNNFNAYPMRYNNAAITTSADSTVWHANYLSMFMFDGTYWQFLCHGLDSNTTYSSMSTAEGKTGTGTSGRILTATNLKQIIEYHASNLHDDTKQDKIIAGSNIQIASDGKTISATDTTYTAGNGIDITNNEISANTTVLATKTDLNSKQDTISDLAAIRSGAGLGATAVQPGDNISDLNNDSGFITNSYHDNTKQDTLVSGNNIKTINNQSLLGTGDISINGILSGPLVPAASSQYAGKIWFDTSNNIFLKCNGTSWEVIETNTKTFYLSSLTDNTTAKAAYDWYLSGKYPIIVLSGGTFMDGYMNGNSFILRRVSGEVSKGDTTTYSSLNKESLYITISSGSVVEMHTIRQGGGVRYLDTNEDYSTPYTPLYDGSPATKKYVDDKSATVMTASEYSQVSNPVAGKIYFIKES